MLEALLARNRNIGMTSILGARRTNQSPIFALGMHEDIYCPLNGRHCGQYFGHYLYQKYLPAFLGQGSDYDLAYVLQVYLSCLCSD